MVFSAGLPEQTLTGRGEPGSRQLLSTVIAGGPHVLHLPSCARVGQAVGEGHKEVQRAAKGWDVGGAQTV